jgi:hypothetical protein
MTVSSIKVEAFLEKMQMNADIYFCINANEGANGITNMALGIKNQYAREFSILIELGILNKSLYD